MRVAGLLREHLRDGAAKGPRERTMELDNSSRVQELVGLPPERVRLIQVNGKGATLASSPEDGYRVALFSPELSSNTFVSLSFRKERVEARQRGRAREGA
jgi:hypothetical protein